MKGKTFQDEKTTTPSSILLR